MSLIIKSKPIELYWAKEPVVTFHPEKEDDRLELMEDWHFEVITKKGVHRFTILAGFTFEGSVPRMFWRVITPTDPGAIAGYLIHDWLYQLAEMKFVKREDADECLFLAIKGRFPWLTVRGVYYAVRLGGGDRMKKPLSAGEKYEIRNML
jgi:hypothetical protein